MFSRSILYTAFIAYLSASTAHSIDSQESRTFLQLRCETAKCESIQASIHQPASIRSWGRPLQQWQIPLLGQQVERWVRSIRGDSIEPTGFVVWAQTVVQQMKKGLGNETSHFRFDLANGMEDLIEWSFSNTLGAAQDFSAPTTVSTTYDPLVHGDFNPMLAGYYPSGFRLRAKDSNREIYFGYSQVRNGGGIDYEGSFYLGHKDRRETRKIGSSVKLILKEYYFGKVLMRSPITVFPKFARTLFPELSGNHMNELAEWTAPLTKALENGGVKFREFLKRGDGWNYSAIKVSEKEFDALLSSLRSFELPSSQFENSTYRSGRRCRIDTLDVGLPNGSDGEVIEKVQQELAQIGLPSVKSTPSAATVRLALWSTLYKGLSRNIRVKPAALSEEGLSVSPFTTVSFKWIVKNVTQKVGNKTQTEKRACAMAYVYQKGATGSWIDLGCGNEVFGQLELVGQKIAQDALCPSDVN